MADYRRLAAQGAVLALGTDVPLVPVDLSQHLALRALHAHGFTVAQALRSATSVPDRICSLDGDLGTVEEGRIADLTVVNWLEVARSLRRDSCCHAGDRDTY
ncbi:amidohydrolase family protein [Streptomyces sp. NPDC001165]|uniref:amidohydrolase family protein n=1 Tax=Streptomyces sp. NPDC001165 TaxID=3364546 RepID=UPI0036B93252